MLTLLSAGPFFSWPRPWLTEQQRSQQSVTTNARRPFDPSTSSRHNKQQATALSLTKPTRSHHVRRKPASGTSGRWKPRRRQQCVQGLLGNPSFISSTACCGTLRGWRKRRFCLWPASWVEHLLDSLRLDPWHSSRMVVHFQVSKVWIWLQTKTYAFFGYVRKNKSDAACKWLAVVSMIFSSECDTSIYQ